VEHTAFLAKCIGCGKNPEIKHEAGDLYYAFCNCRKWDRWEFCGLSKKSAIEQWNLLNRPMKRAGHPRGKKDEVCD